MKFLLVILFAAVLQTCTGARILAILPNPSKSHQNLMEKLVVELAGRGHQVTFFAPFRQPKPVANLTEIIWPDDFGSLFYDAFSKYSGNETNLFRMKYMSSPLYVFLIPQFGLEIMDKVLETQEMQDLIASDQQYDLILGEAFWDECILAGFSQKFKAPMVALNPYMTTTWSSFMVGNPFLRAHVPDHLLGYSDRMSFLQRLINTVIVTLAEMQHIFLYLPVQDSIMRKHFGGDLPPLQEIIKNVSLVLIAHHHALAFPRPYVPNMIEIGGFHVNPPKPLPSDLQKFMDESKHGVILFSMGSILQSTQMPTGTRKAILNAFSRLKQDILWKFEDENMSDLPRNVKVLKWLPQSDILAHPKLKLFITHGGLLSTTEAIVRGIPLVGIPVLNDQPSNMKQVSNLGLGVTVDINNLTGDVLFDAVTEVINSPQYAKTAKLRSQILQDSPLSAIENAMYWIEYVIRHKGATHLRSTAQDLAWYQLHLLDVIAALAIGVVAGVAVTVYLIKTICRRIFCNKCEKTDKTKPRKKNSKLRAKEE